MQNDGHSEIHFLNFKQLDEGCICGEIHFVLFSAILDIKDLCILKVVSHLLF